MNHTRSGRARVDVELRILVPILTVLLAVAVVQLWAACSSASSSGGSGAVAVAVVQGVLRLTFYVLMISLLLVRKGARSKGAGRRATIAAYVGTFAPFLLILGGAPASQDDRLALAAVLVTIVGLGLSVYALGWLGRSFGVVPQARELVRSGPYRYVRHPLYVAELVTFSGAVLAGISVFSLLVLVFFVSVQAYRAMQEEKVLRQAFPEYESYMSQAGRFTPRLPLTARAS